MKNIEFIPVRLSHLLRHCSVGAIVRGPEYLMTVKDIREWTDRNGVVAGQEILYVDGVRAALGISQKLRKPPIARELEKGLVDGVCIPAMRFPSWMRCPDCGLLYYRPWKSQTQGPPCCEKCEKREKYSVLEQVPWVMVHPDGHMNDVPWHYLAHAEAKKRGQGQCGADWKKPYLSLLDEGMSRRKLYCNQCKITRELGDEIRIFYGKAGRQPWLKDPPAAIDGSVGDKPDAIILEINDARLHSAITCNALVIPPESRIRKGTVVDRLYRSSPKLQRIEQAKRDLARKGTLKTLASELRCMTIEIEDAWKEIQKGYPLYGKNITPGILLESEYKALLDEIPDMLEDEDFVIRHLTPTWKAMLLADPPVGTRSQKIVEIVSRLISVDRLKEIQVLKAFQRLGGTQVPPDIVGESAWLPAIELYGEGIFFTLEEKILSTWEKLQPLQERAKDFHRRYVNAPLQSNPDLQVSPRFLLLHTLAHLLIRQLETEAGYPAASLKERIYCKSGNTPMAGILVYVAVPDVVGSLGGLAELAETRRFLSLLSSVFDHAEWCSLDPVCSEHEGQGPSLLNRAACHACALIPEPCCAYGNVLLDRTFIRGDLAAGIPALLDHI